MIYIFNWRKIVESVKNGPVERSSVVGLLEMSVESGPGSLEKAPLQLY